MSTDNDVDTGELAFTGDELIEAIRKALEGQREPTDENPDPGTITSPEAAKELKISQSRAYSILNQMAQEGIILKKDWVERIDDWTGKPGLRKGYRRIDMLDQEKDDNIDAP